MLYSFSFDVLLTEPLTFNSSAFSSSHFAYVEKVIEQDVFTQAMPTLPKPIPNMLKDDRRWQIRSDLLILWFTSSGTCAELGLTIFENVVSDRSKWNLSTEHSISPLLIYFHHFHLAKGDSPQIGFVDVSN